MLAQLPNNFAACRPTILLVFPRRDVAEIRVVAQLEVWRQYLRSIDFLLTDVTTPKIDGIEFSYTSPKSGPGSRSRGLNQSTSSPQPARTDLCDNAILTGSEFLRRLRRLARRRRVHFQYDPSLGKGSHGRVWLETASTTLKDPKKELGTGLFRAMCRDPGIEPRDL